MKIIFSTKQLLPAVIASFALAGGLAQSHAAIANVSVGSGGLKFSPATLTISQGDQIVWTWAGSNHSTTGTNNSGALIWDSAVHSLPFSYTNSFPTAGTFQYYCTVHVNAGMRGVLTVNAVSAPVASLLSGSKFIAATNFQFNYSTVSGSSYAILRATSLSPTNWIPLATNVASTAVSTFVDTNTPAVAAYYRVQSLP